MMQHAFRLWRHLARQELQVRYRGTATGPALALLTPLAQVVAYGFVFGVVFRVSWPGVAATDHLGLALHLFTGLAAFAAFAELVAASPGLLVRHANYVRRVVMPLEVLPAVPAGSAFVHAVCALGLAVLMGALDGRLPSADALWALPVLLLLLGMGIGIALWLAAFGVYLRDLQHTMPLLLMLLMTTGAVLFPPTAVPASFAAVLVLNPVAWPVDAIRDALWAGQAPEATAFLGYAGAVALSVLSGLAVFRALRPGFADVL